MIAAVMPLTQDLEQLLSSAFGTYVTVTGTDHIAPWSVLRCRIEGPNCPESVIAKWLREDPNGFRVDPEQVRTEQAALEFLADLNFERSPRFLAADQSAHLLVIEDLNPRIPLAQLLRSTGVSGAGEELHSFARTVGELGAATVGNGERFYARRRALGPVRSGRDRELFRAGQWSEARRLLESLRVRMATTVERELENALTELAEPGPFLTMSNGDPEANNYLVGDGGGKIIDFEFARYRHAAADAVWMHVPGPMWITVADPIVSSVEDEYRRALAVGIPQAADDRLFGFGLSAACVAWAIARVNRFAVLDGRAEGDLSRLQMVSILESAADTTQTHRSLPAVRGWLRHVAEFLRGRWKDADIDLSTYQSYSPRHP